MRTFSYLVSFCFVILLLQCKNSDDTTSTPEAEVEVRTVKIPAFNRDTAFHFIEEQLSFGPRVPNSDGHTACRQWITEILESYGGSVLEQNFNARTYFNQDIQGTNIIGQFNPTYKKRILLAAHWDTRYIAEEDDDVTMRDKPLPGADDGASGVAILLEIARTMKENPINLGVDLIFFDAEDQGERESNNNESWCLGSQYWSKNLHIKNYRPKYGILLDMVGARNAMFNKENVSGLYSHASQVHALYTKVWNLAQGMGKGNYFIDSRISGIIDDHYFVNLYTGIPMINIINKPVGSRQGFGDHWHTHNDDIDVIDKQTLSAVGQVVTAIIYKESGNSF
jgi:Zn-dependent M28 family amino/carboxypeptidase